MSEKIELQNKKEKTTKKEIKDLKKEIEIKEKQNKKEYNFESLEKEKNLSPTLKKVLKDFGEYIDLKLGDDFSNKEKEIIKLSLTKDILNNLNINENLDDILKKLLNPINDLLEDWNTENKLQDKNKKTDYTKKIGELSKNFDNLFNKMGLEGKIGEVNKKLDTLKKYKKENNTEIKTTKDVFKALGEKNNKTDKQIYEETKKELTEVGKKMQKGKEKAEKIKENIKELPFGNKVIDFIKEIAREMPILGFFLMLIFGKSFFNESPASGCSSKSVDSIKNLKESTKDNDFPFKDKFDSKKIDELIKTGKLKNFFKYLDKKNIDYSKKTFWKELLTGNTKDEKIKKIYELLKNDKGEILGKNDKFEDLIKKLNNLGENELKKEKENLEKKGNKVTKIEKEASKVLSMPILINKKDTVSSNVKTPKKEEAPKIKEEKKENKQLENKKTKTNNENNEKNNIVEELKKEKLTKFFSDEFNLMKYGDIIVSQNLTLKDYRKNLLEAYNNETTKKAFEGVETIGDLFVKSGEILNKIKKIKMETKNNLAFIESINNINSLPATIDYFGEKLKLDIKDKHIILGNKEYKITINTKFGNQFKSIEFKNGHFIINGNEDTPITKEQVKDLIIKLKSGEKFEFNGSINNSFVGKVDYKLIIGEV